MVAHYELAVHHDGLDVGRLRRVFENVFWLR